MDADIPAEELEDQKYQSPLNYHEMVVRPASNTPASVAAHTPSLYTAN